LPTLSIAVAVLDPLRSSYTPLSLVTKTCTVSLTLCLVSLSGG
jgi:hypothetical protein